MKVKHLLLLSAVVSFLFIGYGLSFEYSQQNDFDRIFYVLSIDENDYEYFHVKIELKNVDSEALTFRMPFWTPGAYRIRNYPENIRNFQAFNKSAESLSIEKISEDAWRVNTTEESLSIEYDVNPIFDFWSGKTLDSAYALVQGPSVFMYLEEKRMNPILIKYILPEGWQIVSPLRKIDDSDVYYAENYDMFIDAPAQLGYFKQYAFSLKNIPVQLVFNGNAEFAVDSFLVMVKDICKYQTNLFGEIPFEKYVFFYKLLPGRRSGGGLEHLNSTTIGLSSLRLAESVITAADVTAHEFFHVWNVKGIRPKGLGPFDYTKEVRTKALWFCEGVTSYYAALTLVRTNIWSQEKFIDDLEKEIERLQQTRDRHQTSVERASWSIWERGYSFPGLSYYNKGHILGMLLDLAIRHYTKNRFSFDDVMRFMNWWFAKEDAAFEPGEIKRAINAISQKDFSDFFDKYVSGTVELPYEKILAFAGLNTVIKSEWIPDIGDFLFVGPRNRVVTVEANSPAEEAGLRRRDYLLAVNNVAVSSLREIKEIVKAKEIGSEIVLKVLRDEVELNLTVKVGRKEKVDCEIYTNKNATQLQMNIQKGWLEGWASHYSSH